MKRLGFVPYPNLPFSGNALQLARKLYHSRAFSWGVDITDKDVTSAKKSLYSKIPKTKPFKISPI
jgi:hypothetical protein